MKNVILATIIASVFASSAMAGTTSVDVYADHANTSSNGNLQGFKLKHSLEFGTEFSLEMKTDNSTDFGIAHQFNITDNFYVTPSFNYVFNKQTNESIERAGTFDVDVIDGDNQSIREVDGFQRFETLGNGSDVAQIALKTGYNFDFGLYTSARYRMEYASDKSGAKVSIFENVDGANPIKRDSAELSTRSKIARTDLIVGYNFDSFKVEYTAIHQSETNKDISDIYKLLGEKYSGWSSEAELAYIGFDTFQPYVQYIGKKIYSGLNDNAVRIGVRAYF